MTALLVTIIISFLLLLLAMAGLGIGWLIRGRPFERGCGKKPNLPSNSKKSCEGDRSSCEICNPDYAPSEKKISEKEKE